MIVGYSAGAGNDVMARTLAPYVARYLGEGTKIVVRNVPGASGQIGVTTVAHAAPDGYTIGTYNLPGAMARTLDRNPDYTADSFTYIANVVDDPNVVVTSRRYGADSLERLLDEARKEPGAVTNALPGIGGDDHIALVALQQATGAEFTVVPFKGSAPSRTALMGGHVGMSIINLSEALGFRDELHILGIATEDRSSSAPDVPTLKEQGIDVVHGSLRGFVAPAGMPSEIEEKLIGAFESALADTEFQAAMRALSIPVLAIMGDDYRTLNDEQLEFARKIWATSPWK